MISNTSSVISFCLIFTFCIGTQVSGTLYGAPVSACSTMTPEHGFSAQTSPSPYVTIPTVKMSDVEIAYFYNNQLIFFRWCLHIVAHGKRIGPVDSNGKLEWLFNIQRSLSFSFSINLISTFIKPSMAINTCCIRIPGDGFRQFFG